MPVLSVRVTDEQATELKALAKATNRKRSYLVGLAVDQLIKENKWQILEIKKAIEEADKGDFATEEEMKAIRSKWM